MIKKRLPFIQHDTIVKGVKKQKNYRSRQNMLFSSFELSGSDVPPLKYTEVDQATKYQVRK